MIVVAFTLWFIGAIREMIYLFDEIGEALNMGTALLYCALWPLWVVFNLVSMISGDYYDD